MTGLLALLGGQEHTAGCEVVDRLLLQEAGHSAPTVTVVLAATTPRRRAFKVNEALSYWGALGVAVRFAMAGGPSEEDQAMTALADPDLVVLTGGHPWLLHKRLEGSPVLQRIVELWHAGVPLSGSSAGAIALCEWRQRLQPPRPFQLVHGALSLVARTAAAPHYDRYGLRHWSLRVSAAYPRLRILGLTDRTALVGRDGDFRVHGAGTVTLLERSQELEVSGGGRLELPDAGRALRDVLHAPQPGARRDSAVSPALLRLVQRGVGSLD